MTPILFYITSAIIAIFPAVAVASTRTPIGTKTRTSASSPYASNADKKLIVRKLWPGIPDHGINPNSLASLSDEFFTITYMAFDMPGTDPTGIGDEEFLYYWYIGQDTFDNDGIVDIDISNVTSDKFTANVKYRNCGNTENHTLEIIKQDDKWVIDDFDNFKNEIYSFLNEWIEKYSSGEYKKNLDQDDLLSPQEKREYIAAVDAFLNKYLYSQQQLTIEEPPVASDNNIYTCVELKAQFPEIDGRPGGHQGLMEFIAANIRYPESAILNEIQGRVILKFVVEKDGSISNVTLIRGIDRALDQEAIRILKKMPKWTPGYLNGKPVRTWFTCPVLFKLKDEIQIER